MRHRRGIRVHLFALVAAAFLASATLPAQRSLPITRYRLTDVVALPGIDSEAAGVNLYGEVAGTSITADGGRRAFRYRNGVVDHLGTLVGGLFSEAAGISDTGIVVGTSGQNASGLGFPQMEHGFVWENGTMRSTGELYCICSFNRRSGLSRAYAVDSRGFAVGHSLTVRASRWQAFITPPGGRAVALVDISTPDGLFDSVAYGINDRHEIVGEQAGRAFLMRDGMRESLGVLPGDAGSSARAINALGQVAGFSIRADGVRRAVVWDGTMRELPRVPGSVSSEALAINIRGDVVGRAGNADLSDARAVLWQDGSAIDLNARIAAPGWLLITAVSINDVGQIAGTALRDRRKRAYLLRPE